MGLEVGNFIADLVDTNPPGTDQKLQGDDHLRLIKKCVKGTFPSMNAASTITPTILNNLQAGTIKLADGALGTPSLAFTADADVGIWRPGGNILGFTVNGLDMLRLGPTSLTLGNDTFAGSILSIINTAAGQLRDIAFRSAGVNRWLIRVTNDAEGGGNAGSNFQISARDDAGASLGNILNVDRATLLTSFGGQTVGVNGSAGAPTWSFASDPDTGMYRVAANTLGFAVNATEQVRIDSGGIVTAFGNIPRYRLNDLNAAANEKVTELDGNSGFAIQFLDDSNLNDVNALAILRSGTTPQGWTFTGTLFNFGSGPVQVTTIEVGHASDTTLSRVSAGVVAVEGVNVLTTGTGIKQGRKTLPVMASAMIAATTNGPSAGAVETATNKINYRTLDFDQTTQEFAHFQIPFPKSWNKGTVTFQPIWTAAAGAGGVVWELEAVAISDDDVIDAAYGTAQGSTDTLIATTDLHVGPESAAITIAGTPVNDDTVFFRIKRAPANGSDTLTADARLIGIRIFYTDNAADDT